MILNKFVNIPGRGRPSSARSSAREVQERGAEVMALMSAMSDDSGPKWPNVLMISAVQVHAWWAKVG